MVQWINRITKTSIRKCTNANITHTSTKITTHMAVIILKASCCCLREKGSVGHGVDLDVRVGVILAFVTCMRDLGLLDSIKTFKGGSMGFEGFVGIVG
jgi:hypothetical protein